MRRRGASNQKVLWAVAAVAVLAAAAVVNVDQWDGQTDDAPADSPDAPPAEFAGGDWETAAALLDELPVKGRAPKTGYDRAEFGRAWMDTDSNGCDTRNDVLRRDLTELDEDGDGCTILSGVLEDPYSGELIEFTRGVDTSAAVQIDHVVALMNAWETGAQQLPQERREALANDPLNLQATAGSLNQSKGAGDAATWLPPRKSYRCEYVTRQVQVKTEYELWVTEAERNAIAGILSSCEEAT